MHLLTFGGLSIAGSTFRREKPLLLLAYLALEGSQSRRRLADLFWPDAANPMNSLAQNLIRLRPLGDAVQETDQRVEARISCDALEFKAHLRAGRWTEATQVMNGVFLDTIRSRLSTDLEEWLLDTRETLGEEVRAAHLALAEHAFSRGHITEARHQAERAYGAPGAPPCPPGDLTRLWALVAGSDHPLALSLRRDANELQLPLAPPAPPPSAVHLIGRVDEVRALTALTASQIGWVSGPANIGKTALLRSLSGHGWRYLPARGSLPLSTFEPVNCRPMRDLSDALDLLRDTRLKLAIDDWDALDDMTRTALTLTARHGAGAALVIGARTDPAFTVTQHVALHVLSETDLESLPGAYAATGGHPLLLNAFVHGASTSRTLGAHLDQLGSDTRRLFLALAAQEVPDLSATRVALHLSPAALAAALDQLTREGLTTPGGSVRPTMAAQDLLGEQAHDTALLHVQLARHLPPDRAWPHWVAGRHLWDDTDTRLCAAAAHWQATQQMERGAPAQAETILALAPSTPEIVLLRGWTLVDLGRAPEALRITSELPLTDDLRVLRASAHLYCGQPREAQMLVAPVTPAMTPIYGQALVTLGHCAERLGDPDAAAHHYRAAANVWHLLGDEAKNTDAQVHLATLDSLRLGVPSARFTELLQIARTPALQGTILVNSAHVHHRAGQLDEALRLGGQAERCYRSTGDQVGLANALNTQAVVYHLRELPDKARPLYREALTLARRTGHVTLIAMIASNLAEIEGHFQEFEQIITFLRQVGHGAQADRLVQHAQAPQRAPPETVTAQSRPRTNTTPGGST